MIRQKIWMSTPGVVSCDGSSLDELMENILKGIKPASYCLEKSLVELESAAIAQIEKDICHAISLFGKERIGICVGSCDNGTDYSIPEHKNLFLHGKFSSEYKFFLQRSCLPAHHISKRFGLNGVCTSFSTACASSASAVVTGIQLLKSGFCDCVIVGGVDIVSPVVVSGFSSLDAISSHGTNPFSLYRDGISLGDGAAFFLITKEDIFNSGVEILGYGESCDAFHMTAPESSGNMAAEAIKKALAYGNISPDMVDYVNLHGTGTKLNDLMESNSLKKVFKDNIPFASSTKPFTGHTLGAAGAMEASVCFSLLKSSGIKQLPPHLWDNIQDPELPEINLVNLNTWKDVWICMSNSFAFGGCNVSLIFRRSC